MGRATSGAGSRDRAGAWLSVLPAAFRSASRARLPAGAILLPEIPGYPEDAIEVIAPASVRETLPIAEGAAITLALV